MKTFRPAPDYARGYRAIPDKLKDAVRKGLTIASPIFLATVVIPTLLALLYFGLFASDVYVSESRFVARSPTKTNVSPLAMLLGGGAMAGGSEEGNAIIEYLESRRALEDADGDGMLSKAYRAPGIFWFDRFGGTSGTSREQFYKYFLKHVTVEQETKTQVLHLTVRAFSAQEAEAINARLLNGAEQLVNQLSERSREDSIRIAAGEFEEAKQRAREAAVALAAYRNRVGIIDPEKEATVRLQMISKLQDELIAARTQLQQVESLTPQASQIPFLRTRVGSLEREIRDQTAGVAGGSRSLSAAAARYQELLVDSELAEKQLAASLQSWEEARAEGRRKRAYVERIADPNRPDYALEPRRLRGILATFFLGLVAWGVLSMLIIGIREHRD